MKRDTYYREADRLHAERKEAPPEPVEQAEVFFDEHPDTTPEVLALGIHGAQGLAQEDKHRVG